MACSSCGNPACTGCLSCAQNVLNSGVVLTKAQCEGVRPCSPLDSCSNPQPASPSPYYNCTSTCEEDHCQQIFTQSFATAICTNYAFNVPACGETANVYFSDVKILPVGAYIWHADYGYFEIVAFNNQTGLATILNHCNEDNAAVGTNVPACTCFVVTPTPVPDNDPTNFPFVAVDFIAPADGDCLDIGVTSVNGLVVGGSVAIGDGIYRLEAVVSPDIITICNDGEGITPGTVVEAKNEAGEYQYPITQIGANPCSGTAVSSGVVLVCDSGAMKPLDGTVAGQLLVLQNAGSNIAAFVDPCTAVSSCITPVDPCADYENIVAQLFDQSTNVTGTITLAQNIVSDIATIIVTNSSTCRTMVTLQNWEFFFESLVTVGSDEMALFIELEANVNGGGFVVTRDFSEGAFVTAGQQNSWCANYNLAHVATLAPGISETVDIRMRATNSLGGTIQFTRFLAQITGIAVAV